MKTIPQEKQARIPHRQNISLLKSNTSIPGWGWERNTYILNNIYGKDLGIIIDYKLCMNQKRDMAAKKGFAIYFYQQKQIMGNNYSFYLVLLRSHFKYCV